MAIWRVCSREPKSVAEREIWIHPDKGRIVRETLFNHAAYFVATEDNDPPEFVREAVPDGDGEEDSVDMNFCGYETQLIELTGGIHLVIIWPDKLEDAERVVLENSWDEGGADGWEESGWTLDDTEVWVWGDLDIELVEPTVDTRADSNIFLEEQWNPASINPLSVGVYSVETLEKVTWPNLPITKAHWDGEKWNTDSGEIIEIALWK
jgi:hypothetical protein